MLVMIGAVLVLGGCQRTEPPPRRLPPRVLSTLTDWTKDDALSLRGVVAASARLRLGFKLGGIVHSIRVHTGDRVRKGQLLAKLDTADAEARRRLAVAGYQKAKRDLERAQRLAGVGAATVSGSEDAQTQYELSTANVTLANDIIHRSRLVAPVAGTVFRRLAEPGEAVPGGAPVLLVDETEMPVVRAGVTGRDLERVTVGARASGVVEGGTRIALRVQSIAPTPDPSDGLYAVELIAEPAPASRPGALVDVTVEEGRPAIIRVPLAALVHRQDRYWAFVVEGPPTEPVAHARPLELGDVVGDEVVVRGGLHRGERIVTEGAYFLRNGQAVQLAD
jgi:RND family efflux transporter MFP subunit